VCGAVAALAVPPVLEAEAAGKVPRIDLADCPALLEEVLMASFSGTSTGGTATIEEAFKNALVAAQGTLNVNYFAWTVARIRGDYGGGAVKNITVEIETT
jgi:hypothetical protein